MSWTRNAVADTCSSRLYVLRDILLCWSIRVDRSLSINQTAEKEQLGDMQIHVRGQVHFVLQESKGSVK